MNDSSNRPFEIEKVTSDNQIVSTKKNVDRLADYLFLDLLVDESHMTTPVAFAVSRIQTFIQSARLGTVPDYKSVNFDESKWSWLRSYGSWHARQTVSHYPEGFLIPEIRKNISPGFEQAITRLNEGGDVETVATEYLSEIDDFINIRYYTSLVINQRLFIFARNEDGKFFYSVVKEDGSWIGWRTVPANIQYFPAKPVNDIQLIYTSGYLNFFRLGANEENKNHLYHIPIKLVGSRLKMVDDQNESKGNGESWQRTSAYIPSICYRGGEKSLCQVKDWTILTHGEINDLYGIPLGQGFIIYAVVDHKQRPIIFYSGSSFIVSNGRVVEWQWQSLAQGEWQRDWEQVPYDVYVSPQFEDIVQLKAIQNGRGMLWVMREEIQGETSESLYFSSNSQYPPYPDSPDHVLIKKGFIGQHYGFLNTSLDEVLIFYEEIITSANGEENHYLVALEPGGKEITRFRLSDELRNNADLDNPITGAYIGDERYIVGGLSYDSSSHQKWMSFYTNISTTHQTNIGVPLIDDHPQLQDDQSTAKAFFAEMEDDGGAYGYLEECYLHLPTLMAESLNQNQQYAKAFEWLQKIYDPLDPLRFEDRSYPPFHPQNIATCSYSEMQIWMEDKLDPYVVAGECGNVYLSNVKMRHIRNLLDWADYLFVQDTNESVNRARELYELAAGIHKTLESPDETLGEESDGADGFPIPQNPMINILQWRIESNLTKIRTNRNFAGIQRNLQPYATPLDPTRFLKDVTSGGGIYEQSIPSGPPSVYRYAFLLERAKYLAGVAQQFENSMLLSIEKEEEATYNYMRARQDVQLEHGNVTLQSLRLRESEDARRQALEQLARANTQWSHYDDLINEGLIGWEKAAILTQLAAFVNYQAAAIAAGWSGSAAQITSSQAAAFQAASGAFQMQASFARRNQEWEFQRDLAKHDIAIADIGVDLADDRIDIVDKEWEIANLRLGFANDVVEYMENERFTNPQLYRWMNRNLEALYRDQLNMAIATAKAAQQALEFERQTSLDFIGYDYWDDE
ncbi:MAG: neuraminidase-like domain-containing protein, partial [Candidatus Hermodarchaeia archaeon]